MLRGVIFDFDGVIVDSHPAHLRAWRTLFESMGREASDQQLQFVLEGSKREDILRHFLGDLTPQQIREYGERKDALFRDLFSDVEVMAGIRFLLDELRSLQIPSAVASSASRGRVEAMLDQLALRACFRFVVTGDDVEKSKPDPAIFHLAARGLKVEPEEIVVCEDSVAGIRGAKTAGMKCLGIASADRRTILIDAGADRVVVDFRSVRVSDLQKLFVAGAIGKL